MGHCIHCHDGVRQVGQVPQATYHGAAPTLDNRRDHQLGQPRLGIDARHAAKADIDGGVWVVEKCTERGAGCVFLRFFHKPVAMLVDMRVPIGWAGKHVVATRNQGRCFGVVVALKRHTKLCG